MKKLGKVISFNILILFLLVIAVEITLRAKGDTYTWSEKGQNIYIDPWEQDQFDLIHIRTPGRYVENYSEFDYNLEVNEDGIRDIVHSERKPLNSVRILGLGDSFMEGMGAPFDSTILSLLESKLNDTINNHYVEALSGGVAGSDIFRSFNLLDRSLIKYNPDLIIILFNNTDIGDWIIKGNELGTRPPISPPSALGKILFKYSHLYRTISINVFGHTWLQLSKKQQQDSWNWFKIDFEKIILKFNSLMKDEEKILVVFHPLVHELEQGQYFYPFEELKVILKINKIRYFDVMECLQKKQISPYKIYWKQDMHFNARGYNLLTDCILESNLVFP